MIRLLVLPESPILLMVGKSQSSLREPERNERPKAVLNAHTLDAIFGVLSWLQDECSVVQLLYRGNADPEEDGSEGHNFKTFGKSRVSDVGRDGSVTYTFEEDDDTDAQSLSSQLLGRS